MRLVKIQEKFNIQSDDRGKDNGITMNIDKMKMDQGKFQDAVSDKYYAGQRENQMIHKHVISDRHFIISVALPKITVTNAQHLNYAKKNKFKAYSIMKVL